MEARIVPGQSNATVLELCEPDLWLPTVLAGPLHDRIIKMQAHYCVGKEQFIILVRQ